MPSPSPSICVLGQFCKKYLASAQDVICEQRVLPSQRALLEVAEVEREGIEERSGKSVGCEALIAGALKRLPSAAILVITGLAEGFR
jgi:hypothetical protein